MARQLTFKPRVEPLENRCMLAGNVNAFVNDGDLYVNGNNAANTISVESAGAGVVQVRGFDGAGSATYVNGTPNGMRTFRGVTGDIFIRLRGGNDLVRVSNLVVPGDLLVDLAAGNDEVVLGRDEITGDLRFGATASGPLYVHGDLRVLGGAHNDRVLQSDLHVNDAGVLNLGAGNDVLQVRRILAHGQTNVEYAGLVSIVPGTGADDIGITGFVIDDSVAIDKAAGAMSVAFSATNIRGSLTILGDEAVDQVDIRNTQVRDQITVNTYGANDTLYVSAIAARLFVDLGAGNDEMRVVSSNIRFLHAQLGLGADYLNLQNTSHTTIFAFGNEGNDTFRVTETRARDAYFYGEGGFDTFQQSASAPNRIANLRLYTIERRQQV